MSIKPEIKQFKEKLFQYAMQNGFECCEIYHSSSNSFQVKIFKGEIAEYKNTALSGFSFRGIYNGKMAYFSSEKTDESIIPLVIKSAIENSKILEDTDQEELYRGDENYPQIKTYFESLENITAEEKIEAAKLMEKSAYDIDKRVESVDYCAVITAKSEIYISNTKGLEINKKSNYAMGYISARVKENEQTKVAMDAWCGTDWNEFKPIDIAKNAVDKALSALGAKSIKSTKSPIIFEKSAAVDLLESFVSIFYADSVQKGLSLLKDKIGDTIASEAVTIRDDCNLKNGIGNTPFDSEGVATKDKVVVERGILKTYLYNLKTAKKDGVKSTGNGFKNSIKSPIETSVNNFYIEPSNLSPSELIDEMNNGVMITDLSGLHAGTNSISGDFSLLASGYLINNGKKERAIEQITISGNFFKLLEDIDLVADDLYFGIGTIGSPSILVKELSIAGYED